MIKDDLNAGVSTVLHVMCVRAYYKHLPNLYSLGSTYSIYAVHKSLKKNIDKEKKIQVYRLLILLN